MKFGKEASEKTEENVDKDCVGLEKVAVVWAC